MNKFVLGALALAASSTPCLAGSDNEWATLDSDIANLTQAVGTGPQGVSVSGFLRTSYAMSSDIQVGGNDLGGFGIDNARLNFSGTVGGYNVFMSADAAGGTLDLLDAHASFAFTDNIRGQIGSFRNPFLASSLLEEDAMLFWNRSGLASSWEYRDEGFMVSGNFDKLMFQIAAMNGVDGAGNDLAWVGRAAFTLMGNASTQEGAYGATEQTSLTIGAGYFDDSATVSDATAMCIDANFCMGPISAAAEMVDYNKGMGDNTPWDASVSFMFVPDKWEGAFRYEDADDVDNTSLMTLGVNFYQAGHAAKWIANWSTVTSDNNATDGADLIQIGLSASI